MIRNCKLLFYQFQKYAFDTFRFLVPLREKVNPEFGEFFLYQILKVTRKIPIIGITIGTVRMHMGASTVLGVPIDNQKTWFARCGRVKVDGS